MHRNLIDRIFRVCFAAIGGAENGDVRYVLQCRQKGVSRKSFFEEAVWAILVSGISRKSAAVVSARLEGAGFHWDFHQAAAWTDAEWETFLLTLYPDGVKTWPRKKWVAVREVAKALAAFPDETAFRAEFFDGKTESADLDEEDIRRLDGMRLSFIRYTNAQYVIRNMGGDSIKCDRWICELLNYLGVSAAWLKEELAALGISLSLFDVVIWAYCESLVRRVANFEDHFNRLLTRAEC